MEEELQQSLEQVHKGYERAWTLTGSDQAAHERFKYHAVRAVAALGHKCSIPDEAVDCWLERVFEYAEAGRLHDGDDWCLEQVAERSAHCARLATLEAANLKSAHTFEEIEAEFRQLPKDLYAIRRKDTRPNAAAMVHHESEQAARAAERQAVVKPILDDKKWSPNKLAFEANVTTSGVYDYLAGKRRLSRDNHNLLAKKLGIKPEDLPN